MNVTNRLELAVAAVLVGGTLAYHYFFRRKWPKYVIRVAASAAEVAAANAVIRGEWGYTLELSPLERYYTDTESLPLCLIAMIDEGGRHEAQPTRPQRAPTVVAACVLKATHSGGTEMLPFARRMLKAGLSRETIHQALVIQHGASEAEASNVLEEAAAADGGGGEEQFKKKDNNSNDVRVAFLYSLAVSPAHRCRGVGSALVRAAAAVALQRGYTQLRGAAARDGLLAFYHRLGARKAAAKRHASAAVPAVHTRNTELYASLGDLSAAELVAAPPPHCTIVTQQPLVLPLRAVELSAVDIISSAGDTAMVLFYKQPLDRSKLQRSFEQLLLHVPILAGHRESCAEEGRSWVVLSNRGAALEFREDDCHAIDFDNDCFFPAGVVMEKRRHVDSICEVRVTRLANCTAVNLRVQHAVADAKSCYLILKAWANLYNGAAPPRMLLDRSVLLCDEPSGAYVPPQYAVNSEWSPPSYTTPASVTARVKMPATLYGSELYAAIWSACGADTLLFAVDGRRRLRGADAALVASPNFWGVARGAPSVAGVRAAVAGITHGHIRGTLAFLRHMAAEGATVTVPPHDFAATSWLLPFDEVAFGLAGGGPALVAPAFFAQPWQGLAVITPSADPREVIVWMGSSSAAHLEKLRALAEAKRK